MKFAFLLWQDESKAPAADTPEAGKTYAAYNAFYEDAASKGVFQVGDPFQPSAAGTTVSVRDGATTASDGPHGAGPEQLVGFYVLDCADRDEAVSWAARIPAASTGAIEVRPIMAM